MNQNSTKNGPIEMGQNYAYLIMFPIKFQYGPIFKSLPSIQFITGQIFHLYEIYFQFPI